MMSEEKEDMSLTEYVENQIYSYTFKAKNFTKEEMDFVDAYCKKRYDNNRKLMVLDLIRFKEENLLFNLLNEKIEFVYDELLNNINKDKIPELEKKKEKVHWKGFTK